MRLRVFAAGRVNERDRESDMFGHRWALGYCSISITYVSSVSENTVYSDLVPPDDQQYTLRYGNVNLIPICLCGDYICVYSIPYQRVIICVATPGRLYHTWGGQRGGTGQPGP